MRKYIHGLQERVNTLSFLSGLSNTTISRDFLAISCAQNRGLIKKEQKSGQKLRYFTNIQHFPGKNSHFRGKSGQEYGVLCVVRAVCAVWRVRRSISGVRGAGGILIRVNRKTALRGLWRVLGACVIRSASAAGIRARCGALWGCLRRRKPRGGSVGHKLPEIAAGHKKSPERVRAGGYLYFFASSITTAIGKYKTTQTTPKPITRPPPYNRRCGRIR